MTGYGIGPGDTLTALPSDKGLTNPAGRATGYGVENGGLGKIKTGSGAGTEPGQTLIGPVNRSSSGNLVFFLFIRLCPLDNTWYYRYNGFTWRDTDKLM